MTDLELLEALYVLERTEQLRVEPSAAAGLSGPRWLLTSEQGKAYLAKHGISDHVGSAVHIVWTTGGRLMPNAEYEQYHQGGRLRYESSASTFRAHAEITSHGM